MVSQHPLPGLGDGEVMRMRVAPRLPQAQSVHSSVISPAPPPWKIVIPAADGTELLVLREENGMLVAEGDESRWSEAAKRFVHGMLQWAGQAGLNWKDEAAREAGR